MSRFGYNDLTLVPHRPEWSTKRTFALIAALLLIIGFWLALDIKLLLGTDWISATYDNPDWRTNEGNLHTFGAWDIEAHIWKSEYVMENFPNFHWNPYWYLGMPLLKYYQLAFYAVHIAVIVVTGASAARAALLLVVWSHLIAALMTFLLCYKVSRRIWVSALCATFILSNTFISLRSYGWEPITVVFLFLFPLGLLLFLKEPLRPLRFWLVVVIGIAYLCHPLIWFSLLMTMGIYLFSIAVRRDCGHLATPALRQYFGVAIGSILIGAVQFLPQFTYKQATSGAHMGVTYLPFYHVGTNVISLKDFLFDMGNLKGPGPIIMIALALLIIFTLFGRPKGAPRISQHHLVAGMTAVLFTMVLFYYLELWNIFPMNFLRSVQYHRIIPEFIVCAAVVVAALSHLAITYRRKAIYYTMLIAFVLTSTIVVHSVQKNWETTTSISQAPEFIDTAIPGRITMPYTDQSLAVRSSFLKIPQTYGYYEQGITNAYNDEVFSVSSGFQNADLTLLYLQATNVGRIYVNMQEGERDQIVMTRLNSTLRLVQDTNPRYAYFEIPLKDPSFVQAISSQGAQNVQEVHMGCRTLFKQEYCGSIGEEFVATDPAEIQYLRAYVALLDEPHPSRASMVMENPDKYAISVRNATADTSVVVKMTYDADFHASVNGKSVPVTRFGPDFMLITAEQDGAYDIVLEYHPSSIVRIGAVVSVLSLIALSIICWRRKKSPRTTRVARNGDM